MTQHLAIIKASNTPVFATLNKNGRASSKNLHIIPEKEWLNAITVYSDGMKNNNHFGFWGTDDDEKTRVVIFLSFDDDDEEKKEKLEQISKLAREINGMDK